MRKKACALAAVLLAGVLVCVECGGDFDAAGYVQAVLDERLQGEFTEASRIMDTSEYELKQDYEAAVDQFVYAYLTSGYEELSDYTLYEYETIVKEIFGVMKYDVQKAKKTGSKEYEVSVEIQPVDLFINYVPALKDAANEIEQSAQNGGYEGTDEEIQNMMQYDYLFRAYDLLEESYLNMQYSDPETVIVKVEADDGNTYSVSEEEYQALLEQFFRMDEVGSGS